MQQKRYNQELKIIKSDDDFLKDESSLMVLDSICMQLIVVGQGVKGLDKATDKELLRNYPSIPWRNIAGIRDILSNNYFNLNAETIFGILGDDLDNLTKTLEKMIEDLK